jgi:hypothetical protein
VLTSILQTLTLTFRWFMRRATFDSVGGFANSWADAKARFDVERNMESSVTANSKVPEDLIFFQHHLNECGTLRKVHKPLLIYRHHASATSAGIHRLALLDVRLAAFIRHVLSPRLGAAPDSTADLPWGRFSIWGAGRDGKKFFNRSVYFCPSVLCRVRWFFSLLLRARSKALLSQVVFRSYGQRQNRARFIPWLGIRLLFLLPPPHTTPLVFSAFSGQTGICESDTPLAKASS